MHRTLEKYHIVRLRLEPGYYNQNYRMLHACFTLLVEYIEENPEAQETKWDATPEMDHAWKEMNELYNWWKSSYLKRREPIMEVPDEECPESLADLDKSQMLYPVYHEALTQTIELEKKWFQEDQDNLRRLVEVHKYM
jgi:hypothetical protein